MALKIKLNVPLGTFKTGDTVIAEPAELKALKLVSPRDYTAVGTVLQRKSDITDLVAAQTATTAASKAAADKAAADKALAEAQALEAQAQAEAK